MSHAQRPGYLGEPLTHALLQRRREEAEARRARAVGRVNGLLDAQRTIGRELSDGLSALEQHGSDLRQIERAEADTSLLASLVRPFTARRSVLARRSIAEGLLGQYEQVSQRLREATAFSDELKLTALELQQEVDRIHQELGRALHNQRVAATRVLELEAALAELPTLGLTPEAEARRRDRFEFDLRTEGVALSLHKAAADQCRHHLDPARALRNTVLQLHEEMARYVLSATHTVNAAGRRIQGLGMLADAPIVVAELQESLDQLSHAMEATQRYVEQSQRLIGEVLPDLSATLSAKHETESVDLTVRLDQVDRDATRRAAEQALRDSAEDEIRRLLDGDG